MITLDIVIAKYKEDLSWLNLIPTTINNIPIEIRKFIYSKNETEDNLNCIRLPNIGREAHTYLHHIINNYDNLADYVLFSQGDPIPHCMFLRTYLYAMFDFNFLPFGDNRLINDNCGYDQAADLTKLKDELPWLREVYSQSLQFALKCLETAYNNFFSKRAKFPKFHSRKCKQSFTIPQNTEIRDGKLSIPKFKNGIKCKFHREVVGKIKTCTVSKNPSGQYFACIVVERDMEQLPKLDKVVGID